MCKKQKSEQETGRSTRNHRRCGKKLSRERGRMEGTLRQRKGMVSCLLFVWNNLITSVAANTKATGKSLREQEWRAEGGAVSGRGRDCGKARMRGKQWSTTLEGVGVADWRHSLQQSLFLNTRFYLCSLTSRLLLKASIYSCSVPLVWVPSISRGKDPSHGL